MRAEKTNPKLSPMCGPNPLSKLLVENEVQKIAYISDFGRI